MKVYRNQAAARRRGWSTGVSLGLLCFALSGVVWADQSSPQTVNPDTDLAKAQGHLLAQGRNTESTGPLALKTYRVEKIKLAPSIEIEVKGQTKRVDTAYRVTVNGGPFPVRALLNILCVDGVSIPAVTNEELSALIGITFDESLIRNGAPIAVGYGSADAPCDSSLDAYSVLPEKIKLGESR